MDYIKCFKNLYEGKQLSQFHITGKGPGQKIAGLNQGNGKVDWTQTLGWNLKAPLDWSFQWNHPCEKCLIVM